MKKEEAENKGCPFRFSDPSEWFDRTKKRLHCITNNCMAWVAWTEDGVEKGICGLIPGMRKAG